jgi:hypothetical protein
MQSKKFKKKILSTYKNNKKIRVKNSLSQLKTDILTLREIYDQNMIILSLKLLKLSFSELAKRLKTKKRTKLADFLESKTINQLKSNQ